MHVMLQSIIITIVIIVTIIIILLWVVLSGVTRDMLPCLQETFGPVTPLMLFHSEDEAVAMANDTE